MLTRRLTPAERADLAYTWLLRVLFVLAVVTGVWAVVELWTSVGVS